MPEYEAPKLPAMAGNPGWVEPCAAGGTFSPTPSQNTENDWVFFTESGDTAGQVYYNPNIGAFNIVTHAYVGLVGYAAQWTEHCGVTPDGSAFTYSTTYGNPFRWGNAAGDFTPMDMYGASLRYQNGSVILTNTRRLTYRNLVNYPEYDDAICPTPTECGVSSGKQEFFAQGAPGAPGAPNVQDSLLIHPQTTAAYAWGPTTYAARDHLIQGKVLLFHSTSAR